MLPVAHQRTAAEAWKQAKAKGRLRQARAVRGTGMALALVSPAMLSGTAFRATQPEILVNIHGGPHFTLSVLHAVAITLMAVGPVVAATGHLMLKRAIAAARRDPVTNLIFRDMSMD